MRRISEPHWILHSHFMDPDEYQCSRCGAKSKRKTSTCPGCGITLRLVQDDQGWVDEAEEISWLLDDD